MPVNTVAYEILFEFTNDTPDVLHLTGPSGRSVLVERGQDVVLVLTAGLTYQYTLKQLSQPRKAQLSVRAWDDIQCREARICRHLRDAMARFGSNRYGTKLNDFLFYMPANHKRVQISDIIS
ncbi:hypothetical protein B0H19DRAFT_632915 [Mycena capillaripes]|nr:hypothetical protein B0H19DRAFT_632915 [Mycena capillaripes]